jgi:hypothetical protein
MQYTIHNLPGNNFKLQSVDSNESLDISEDHAKFAYVANQATLLNRIIKWDGTKMTSTKDYRGHYNKSTQSTKAPKKPVVVTLTKLDDLNINGESGGGMVKAIVNGKMELLNLDLQKEIFEEDKDLIEDLIISAINNAMTKAQEESQSRMNAVTGGMLGGMKIPGL